MKPKFTAVFVLALLLCLAVPVWAKTITIHNNTGKSVNEIYISHSGTDNWEEDILSSDTLPRGSSFRVELSGSFNQCDLLAITTDGYEMDFRGIDFSRYSEISLNSDGNATAR